MPLIIPIKDLRNTTEISNMAHKVQEPIFVTKNGYSDLVVMSCELYDKFTKINRIDHVIRETYSIDDDHANEKMDPENAKGLDD